MQKRFVADTDNKIANEFAKSSQWTSDMVDTSVREFTT